MQLAETYSENQYRDKPSFREQLIKEYLPYVKRIVQRIAVHLPSGIDLDDLISAGVIGLIEAVDRYDPSRDNKFMTYASFRIKGSILGELRSRDVLSRSNRKKVRDLEKTSLKLEQKLGREATDNEVAAELKLDIDQYYHIKKLSGVSFISLEEISGFSNEEKENLKDSLTDNNAEDALTLTGIKEIKNETAKAIEQLPEKQKLVISLYYQDDLTMKEIGKVLGYTESRVSQIHSQAIFHLREKLRKEELLES